MANKTLEPGFPQKISVETTRKWMHEMGFMVLTSKMDMNVKMLLITEINSYDE